MNVDVYKSNKSAKYLIVSAGQTVTELTVTDNDMKEVSAFKKDLVIDPAKPLIGLNHEAATAAIAFDGYYIQGTEIQVSLK